MEDKEIHDRLMVTNPKEYQGEIKNLLAEHQKLEKETPNIFHKTKLVIKYGKTDSESLAVGYFGSQGRFYIPFLKEYFDKVLKFTPSYFAEAPGGSNSITYGMKRLGIKKLSTCDISYWSWCISRGIVKNTEILSGDELDIILSQKKVDGYLLSRTDLPIKKEVKESIDGIVNYINTMEEDKYYMILALLGKWMLNNLTYRSMTWDKKRMQDDKYCGVEILHNYLKKHIKTFNSLILKEKFEVISFLGDYIEFLNSLQNVPEKGSVLYCDFDWPWGDGRETEVYTWYVKDISSILKGEQYAPNVKFWNKENIKEELSKVIKLGLEKFEYVFLSTQSSNYPKIDELKSWMEEVAVIKDYCFIDTPSLVANKNFREELLILTKKC